MIKAILFDVDGVLLDSKVANRVFYQDVLQNAGYGRLSNGSVDKVFGLTFYEGVKILTKEKSAEKINKIMEAAGSTEYKYSLLRPTDKNAGRVIMSLHRKYRLGIVTGRGDDDIDEIMPALGIKSPFEIIITTEDYKNPKPDPEPLLVASSRLKLHPKECVYVGDLDTDEAAAKAAGMKYILYSKKSKSQKSAHSFKEIMGAIEKLK